MSCPLRSTQLAAFIALLALAGPIPAMLARAEDEPASATFHVSERGKDSWSGTLSAPNEAGTDGPFATPARARDAARRLRTSDKPPGRGDIVILVHAGRYELVEPLVFAPDDSGTAESRTVFAAAPGDEGRAVLSGGRLVSGWRGAPGARGEWVADLPGLKDGWRFRHVSLDGQWRGRPRLPEGETATYGMAGLAGADPNASYDTPADRFEYAPGQVDPSWTNLRNVEVVVPHFWLDSHLKIAAVDPVRRVVTLDRPSRYKFTDEHQPRPGRFYLTNVYQALKPGQFYANPSDGTLHYLPREGETRDRAQLVAPRLASLVEFRGDPARGRFVEHVTLRGLTLSNAIWEPGPRESMDAQASSQVPGAVIATGARHVAFEDCTLRNLAGYAIELRDGCRGVRLAGNELAWIGAGGIKVNGAVDPEPMRTGETIIADNRIHHVGRLFHSGVGVLMMHSFGNTVAHNEISDLYYTGVSVGWVWGYGPSVSRDNRIEFNRIHHVGQGLLSDLAAVYTLGVSPGTVVRNNVVHDVSGHDKGWGLYTDEGSTGIVLEDNLVYRTTHGGFHQHYGRDNAVRNNIFAFGRDAQVVRSSDEPHRSFTFEGNIVDYRTGELLSYVWSGGPDRITLDHNLYWTPAGAPTFPTGSLEAWRARGFDQHSIVADPLFMDPDRDDFRLKPDSPALKLGFRPPDLSTVGPRDRAARGRRAWPRLPAHPRIRLAIALTTLASSFGLRPSVVEAGEAIPRAVREEGTRVPRWDARGVGAMPRQGIACLDVSGDAGFLAVGTVAPPGDPNVVLLDGDGRVVRSHAVGQRCVEQVTVDRSGRVVHALSTMPGGRAGDFCTVYRCEAGVEAAADSLGQDDYALNLFHYGDHSNHLGASLRGWGSGAAAVMGDRVYRLGGGEGQSPPSPAFPRPQDAVTTALAVGPGGHVVVGCTGRLDAKDGEAPNLFLLAADGPRPVWSRQAVADGADRAAPEPGLYGMPTLPDGTREALPQRDVRVSAPLSVALFAQPDLRRIAAADYPGWQRWVRSSATGRDQNHGTRFLPAPPAVTVYDARGGVVRRFGPEQFRRAGWFDLKFLSGGNRLIAYPHRWTSRGLAGQPILPADEDARTVYVLDIETGGVRSIEFPDAVSDLDADDAGGIAASCWDGRVYRLAPDLSEPVKAGAGVDVGGPGLVRLSRDGDTAIVATTRGVVLRLGRDGREVWRTDLVAAAPAAEKPWVKARAEPVGEGVWKLPGGRVESDLGGQWLVRAPDGLILIEGHAGLSFEREWASIASIGLDPRQVRYVLATHEHGDHAPGAYLWRVATGAKFVCSAEMAYALRHHIPLGTGYGFHPPVPTDVRVTEDGTLDLAGLPVRAVRVPGHTAGSMAWMFETGGKRYVAIGDLIMPGGVLGYDGSINFSATDVLASLRKLDALKPDVVLPGHGPEEEPGRYLAAGIDVGIHVGWGKIRPERPDPYFRMTQKNVRVVAWNLGATSADFGDIDGDDRPDVAVVAPDGDEAAVIKLFLNRGGTFRERPDHEIRVAGVAAPTKLRLRRLDDDRIADFLVGGRTAALVLSGGGWPRYRIEPLAMSDANQVRLGDPDARGDRPILVGPRFGPFQVARRRGDRFALEPLVPEVRSPYADLRLVDVNGDGRDDLVSSSGRIFLRREDGSYPDEPSLRLSPFPKDDWSFLGVGDFNGDGRPDLALLDYQELRTEAAVYDHTGDGRTPFPAQPSSRIDLDGKTAHRHPLLRDAPAVADWDGDGVDDLIVGKGQDREVLVLLGGREALSRSRSQTIPLDFRLHYETGLFVGDFDGDGRPDLAAFGDTNTGVGAGGPPSVYLWIRADPSRK